RSVIPSGDIFLLVGRTGQVYDYDFAGSPSQKTIPDLFYRNEDVFANLMDLSTIWVSIGAQSGLIKTAENADSTGAPPGQRLQYARQFARSTRELGGR
ncbi:MAG: hypothetical protein KDA47_23350, partial [Planctomycetales bacterium]|nr:hypothetical protein [Planctomycetales bacterium]